MLIELLTASVLTVLVVGGMGMLVVRALHQQPRMANRAHDIAAGRQLVERFTRELREGSVVTDQSGSGLTFRTYVRSATCGETAQLSAEQPSNECNVRYTCADGTCLRQEFDVGATPGGSVQMVTGLLSDAVFTYTPSPADPGHVSVELVYPSQEGDEGVTISDGAELRNTG